MSDSADHAGEGQVSATAPDSVGGGSRTAAASMDTGETFALGGIPALENGQDLADAIMLRPLGNPGDGIVEVKVDEDWMSATAVFHPPRDDGRPLSWEQVGEALGNCGVSEGILWDYIKEKLLECNLERRTLRDLVVARGTPPEEAMPEHGEIAERFAPKEQFASRDAVKVDFRNLSRLPVVKKGEVVGRLFPAAEGRKGRDIRGKELEALRKKVDNWRAGGNVTIEGDRMVAAIDGLLDRNNFVISIEEVFLVKGGVDYHTGHVVFPGDVVVEGRVGDGFKLWSGANILCKSTLDAFDVNAKKDLVCLMGILGHGTGHVRAGGQLSAKFIENCRVAVRGDIHVQSALMGSQVYSLGVIDLGDKGVIVGGETWAVHGIKAARLGNEARQRTSIHVGVDFTVQQRLDQANERLRNLALRAQQIDVYAAEHPGVDPSRLHAAADRSVEETRNLIISLLPALDGDETAFVEVTGDIWPGTIIEICRGVIAVTKPLRNCRFHLDKVAGRIIVEPLSAKPSAKTPPHATSPASAAPQHPPSSKPGNQAPPSGRGTGETPPREPPSGGR
ncbi:MAG TPA: FapA family protein [Rectinemataceae bacterium]|nr:FapA family protein [Rectinemataceae bacterium]